MISSLSSQSEQHVENDGDCGLSPVAKSAFTRTRLARLVPTGLAFDASRQSSVAIVVEMVENALLSVGW